MNKLQRLSSNNNFPEFATKKVKILIISVDFQVFTFKNRYVHGKKLVFNQDKQSIVFNTVQILRFTKIKKLSDFFNLSGGNFIPYPEITPKYPGKCRKLPGTYFIA